MQAGQQAAGVAKLFAHLGLAAVDAVAEAAVRLAAESSPAQPATVATSNSSMIRSAGWETDLGM